MITTEMHENNSNIASAQYDIDQQNYPLGYGEPIDVAYACVYFISDASKWVTGTNFVIDGGVTTR
jgi:NAD(P)-dependent dehydrogenase (short-subunit alcohol dehydrogenase family)